MTIERCQECKAKPGHHKCYCTVGKALRHYRIGKSRSKNEEELIVSKRPVRQPGDAPCRCFWCDRYKCTTLMQLCSDCQKEYDTGKVTMPKEGS